MVHPRNNPDSRPDLDHAVERLTRPAFEQAPDLRTREGRSWRVFDFFSNWLILILAVVNLGLVLFDYTYLSFRHVYQQQGWRQVVQTWDQVKGIEPHRETDKYLRASRETLRLLKENPESNAARGAIASMQELSIALIDNDPFLAAGLRGVSEQLRGTFKRHAWEGRASAEEVARWRNPLSEERLRADLKVARRPWDNPKLSSKASFIGTAAYFRLPRQAYDPSKWVVPGFWSAENLTAERLQAEANWFEREVVPLLERNYWQTYGQNGEPADTFWLIDCLFLPVFVLEFLIRGFVGVRRGIYPTFTLFVAARWYDVIYFLPLVMYALPTTLQGPLHIVRIISVSARMERLGIINPVEILRPYLARPLDTMADLVNVKLLSNYQEGVRGFSFEEAMETLTPRQRVELERLIETNLAMVVEKVLPDIRPALEALVARTAQQALEQAPAYARLKELPVLGDWPEQVLRRAVAETVAQMQGTMLRTVNDPRNVALTRDLVSVLASSLLRHMATVGTEEQLKAMLVDVLEEQKRRLLTG